MDLHGEVQREVVEETLRRRFGVVARFRETAVDLPGAPAGLWGGRRAMRRGRQSRSGQHRVARRTTAGRSRDRVLAGDRARQPPGGLRRGHRGGRARRPAPGTVWLGGDRHPSHDYRVALLAAPERDAPEVQQGDIECRRRFPQSSRRSCCTPPCARRGPPSVSRSSDRPRCARGGLPRGGRPARALRRRGRRIRGRRRPRAGARDRGDVPAARVNQSPPRPHRWRGGAGQRTRPPCSGHRWSAAGAAAPRTGSGRPVDLVLPMCPAKTPIVRTWRCVCSRSATPICAARPARRAIPIPPSVWTSSCAPCAATVSLRMPSCSAGTSRTTARSARSRPLPRRWRRLDRWWRSPEITTIRARCARFSAIPGWIWGRCSSSEPTRRSGGDRRHRGTAGPRGRRRSGRSAGRRRWSPSGALALSPSLVRLCRPGSRPRRARRAATTRAAQRAYP